MSSSDCLLSVASNVFEKLYITDRFVDHLEKCHLEFSQEYPVNVDSHQGSILGLTLFQLYNIDLLDDVICNIAIYADDATLYSKCD